MHHIKQKGNYSLHSPITLPTKIPFQPSSISLMEREITQNTKQGAKIKIS